MAIYNVYSYEQGLLLGQGDVMNVYGTAAMIGMSSGAVAHVYDGGSAAHFMLYDKGNLKVSSGGYAFSTTVVGSGATFTVHSATVVSTTVGNSMLGPVPQPNYKARMGISSGAFVSATTVLNGGTVITHDLVKLVDVAVSNGGTISGNGGQMSNVIVNSGGKVDIAGKNTTDGLLKTLLVYSGASVTVYNRGIIDDVLICPGAVVNIKSGGTGRVIDRSSRLDSGVIGTLNVFDGGQVWSCIVTHSGVLNVSGGAVSNAHVSGTYLSSPVMNVYSYGYATGTIVDSEAKFYVHSGGTASATAIRYGGSMIISSGAVVENVLAEFGVCKIELRSGASASHVELVGEHASMTVGKGAYVEELSVLGGLSVNAHVSGGGRVSSASVANGKLTVGNGGTVKDAEVTGDGAQLHVSSGGTVNNVTVNGYGMLQVSKGATVDSLTAKRYAKVYISSGAKVTGDIEIVRDATVSAYEGSVVDMDISDSAPGDAARLKGISLISGAPKLTITVSATQAAGSYTIANGASSTFNKTFTVVTDAGATLGTISVGGTLKAGNNTYRLALASNKLSLTVANGSSAPLPGDLNGDGRADVVMTIAQTTHPADGATGAWLIQSDQTPVWGDLSQRNAGWTIFGMGITAAGKSTNDVYVKNTDNVIGAWVTNDSGLVAGWETVGSFDTSAQILGLGDFDGDGQSDLLLRSMGGDVGCYFTGGTKTGWNYFQSLGPEWKISAIGDFNADGRDDVVLVHDAGFAGCWLTQTDGTPMWSDLDTVADGFAVVGAGDFDGDGTSDVMLKNGSYYGAWLVQNGNAAAWFGLGDLGGATVEQVADFDADGKDDLRIRNAAGDIGALLVRGEGNLEWHYYGGVGPEWSTALAAL